MRVQAMQSVCEALGLDDDTIVPWSHTKKKKPKSNKVPSKKPVAAKTANLPQQTKKRKKMVSAKERLGTQYRPNKEAEVCELLALCKYCMYKYV